MSKKKLLASLILCCGWLQAETYIYQAVLSPANEVPAINSTASGVATVLLHVVRDAAGNVESASTDFLVAHTHPADATVTGLHIHRGAAGENGPVVIDSGITGNNPVNVASGRTVTNRQGQTIATNTNGLAAVRGILENHAGYYVNLHTTTNAGGLMRGQLLKSEATVLMGMMSPANEVPPIPGSTASAVASVLAVRSRDASGTVQAGYVVFDTTYSGFTPDVSITGFHIHSGAAGVNGPVTINTGIGGANLVAVGASGGGILYYEVPVNTAVDAQVNTLNGLFENPAGYYVNIHTQTNTGGLVRAQLRRTDQMSFPVTMLTSNEVPALTGLDATGKGTFTAHTLRDDQGRVIAGTVIFDVNHRFPGSTNFTGLHIHNGNAGENGPVTLDSGIRGTAPIESATGFGNIYKMANITTANGLAALNSLVQNPERHYINLHTSVNAGGAVRAQVAAPNTKLAAVSSVISAISDRDRRTVAPGGLMTIFGSDLVKVESDVTTAMPGATLPNNMNGTEVTLGGKAAPILVATPTYIVAQVPTDVATGDQVIVVKNSNGSAPTTQAIMVPVAAAAPGIYGDAEGGIFLKNSDYSLIRRNNRARAGDVVLIYSTGLGQTTPAMTAGQLIPAPGTSQTFYRTAPVQVTVGGRSAEVIYSIASPGFAGLYQTAIFVPAGLGRADAPVQIRMGEVTSNTVTMPVE